MYVNSVTLEIPNVYQYKWIWHFQKCTSCFDIWTRTILREDKHALLSRCQHFSILVLKVVLKYIFNSASSI